MVKVIDILTGKKKDASLSDIISLKKISSDFIVSIPHSGTLILEELEKKIEICKSLLYGSDLFTDKIFSFSKGYFLKFGLYSLLVNVNRFREGHQEDNLPTHLRNNPLKSPYLIDYNYLKSDYSYEETKNLLSFYDEYHLNIQEAINDMKSERGYALLIDGHSMFSVGLERMPDRGKTRPDFAVGTLNDKSAHPSIIAAFYETLKSEAKKFSLSVEKNHPYSGGFITMKYGKPSSNFHSIQLEVKKSNYMNEGLNNEAEAFEINKKGLTLINNLIFTAINEASKEAHRLFSKI